MFTLLFQRLPLALTSTTTMAVPVAYARICPSNSWLAPLLAFDGGTGRWHTMSTAALAMAGACQISFRPFVRVIANKHRRSFKTTFKIQGESSCSLRPEARPVFPLETLFECSMLQWECQVAQLRYFRSVRQPNRRAQLTIDCFNSLEVLVTKASKSDLDNRRAPVKLTDPLGSAQAHSLITIE